MSEPGAKRRRVDDATSRLKRLDRLLQRRAAPPASDPAQAEAEQMNATVVDAMNRSRNRGLMEVSVQLSPALFRCFGEADSQPDGAIRQGPITKLKRLFPGFQRVAGTSRKDREHTGDFRLALNHLKLKMSNLVKGCEPSFQDWLGRELLCVAEECRVRLEEAANEEQRLVAEAEEAKERQRRQVLSAFLADHPATLAALREEDPALAESLDIP